MYTFLMSIIGPNHRKPRTADIGNKLLNERPIMASDVEHREKRKAKASNNALAIGVATSSEPEKKVGFIHTWNRAIERFSFYCLLDLVNHTDNLLAEVNC